MNTEPSRFHLFPSLPVELRLHILTLACQPSPPSLDDLETYHADLTFYPTTMTDSFLRSKMDQYLVYKECVEANGWGGGAIDPMRPWIMLLSCNTVRAQFYWRETELFKDRKRLLWVNRMTRLVALEEWKRDIDELEVRGEVRSEFDEPDRVIAKREFGEVLQILLEDVRGLLRGEVSHVKALWKKQVEVLRRRDQDEMAECEFESE